MEIQKPCEQQLFSTRLEAPGLLLNWNEIREESIDVDREMLPDEYRDWVSLSLCTEGRCECWNSSGHSAVVMPGTTSIGLLAFTPDRYYYPLGYYAGLQLCFSMSLLKSPEFSLLREAGFSPETWWNLLVRYQCLFYHDPYLGKLVKRLADLGQKDVAVCKIQLMGILLYLDRKLLPREKRSIYITAKQYRIAQIVHDRLLAEPFRDHDVVAFAAEYGISLTSLNRYFEAVYGYTAATWLRKYRLREAAELLRKTDRSASEIALAVGYANPSKFSAAFKREFDATPSAFRKMKKGGKTE